MSVCKPNLLYFHTSRNLFSFFILLTILTRQQTANAQHLLTTFGAVSELKTLKNAHELAAADFNGDGNTDIATCAGKKVQVQLFTSDSTKWHSFSWYADDVVGTMSAGNLNRDAYADLVMLSENKKEVSAYLAKPNEKFYLAWKYELRDNADKILLADINNDKRLDLLVYGKKQQGITVMTGKGNGTFRDGILLFPEISFSIIEVKDINNDGLNDVIALNWVTNELLLYSGIGRMKYSEPSAVTYSNEPASVAIADINGDAVSDLMVGFVDERQYQTYLGDGFGGYSISQTADVGSLASQLFSRDLNGDGKNDLGIICPLDGKLYISLNNGRGMFEEHIDFDAGVSASSCVILQSSLSKAVDVAILDSARSRIRIFHSDRKPVPHSKEPMYAVGLNPTDVICADLNHDGWNDIVTANNGSQNFSLLMNRGDGTFNGQIAFELPFKPQTLQAYLMRDSVAVIVGTNAEYEKISVSTINTNNFLSVSYSLPTIGFNEILHVNTAKDNLQIFVLEHDKNNQSVSLTEYDQLDSVRFIQKDITSQHSQQMVACAMSDLNHDGNPDLVYAVSNTKKKLLEFYSSLGTAETVFHSQQSAFVSSIPSTSVTSLWLYDVNDDGNEDMIIYSSEPEQALMISLGRPNQSFDATVNISKGNILVSAKRDMLFSDLNGDDNIDIVVRNNASKTIEIYYGQGNGSFLSKKIIMSSDGIGGFTFADTDHDAMKELILTEQVNGIVKIISLGER